MKKKYDLLLVGGGLFNAIIAREASRDGLSCLVIEKKAHLGGCLFCENVEDITVHKYGAHIFHTKEKWIWEYMSGLCVFNHFVNSPLARYKDKIYNLPFNMNTFYQLWGVITPEQARQKINEQRGKNDESNLEAKALSLVGTDIYYKLIKGYTEKQWGVPADQLPAFIIERLPLRFTYDNSYFSDPYQGVPIGGYNTIISQCFEKCDVMLNTDYFDCREIEQVARRVVFTGMIDEYFDYVYGKLEYRSLLFENSVLDCSNFQGCAVVNYTEKEIPYTRIIEHKHFEFGQQEKTVITKEYPLKWEPGLKPYYPVNTPFNNKLYDQYRKLALKKTNVYFGGRLGHYKYYNMDQVVDISLKVYKQIKDTMVL